MPPNPYRVRHTIAATTPEVSKSPPATWFGGKIAATYLTKFAAGIKCVLQEYDGKTRDPIGKEVTTTVSNAITGQG